MKDVSDGYHDMVQAFTSARLKLPPIPAPLRPFMQRQGRWCWGTRSVNTNEMYMGSHAYLDELLTRHVKDYAAVCHAGHGLNSYALNFILAYGPLCVIAQDSFGGAYRDPESSRKNIDATFSLTEGLLSLLNENNIKAAQSRLIVVWSQFRGVCQFTEISLSHMGLGRDPGQEEGAARPKTNWEHEGLFSGMGWSPSALEDGSKIAWLRYGSRETLFEEAGLRLGRILEGKGAS